MRVLNSTQNKESKMEAIIRWGGGLIIGCIFQFTAGFSEESGGGGGGEERERKARHECFDSSLPPPRYIIRVNKNCGQSKSLSVRPSVNMSTSQQEPWCSGCKMKPEIVLSRCRWSKNNLENRSKYIFLKSFTLPLSRSRCLRCL